MNWIKSTAWPLVQRTFKEFNKDECSRLAASLAYYAVFAIFPLVLLMITILGFWLRARGAELGANAEQELINRLLNAVGSNVSDDIAQSLAPILRDIKVQAGTSAPIALITTLFAASGIFVQLDNAFDTIWNVPPAPSSGILGTVKRTLFERGKAFLLVLSIGVLLVGSLIISTVLTSLSKYAQHLPAGDAVWRWLTFGVSFFLNVLIFSALFYFMPKRELRWRDMLPAALLTALLWEVGKQVLSLYLGNNKYTASATISAFIALLVWIYYASLILFFGAEFSQAYTMWRDEERETAVLATLPPPPELPAVGIRGPEAAAQQKAAYATSGVIVGALAAVVIGGLSVVASIIQALRRR